MLLAGRQGQDEAALALGVDRLAGQPPGHLPNMLFAAREQTDIGSAELQPDADRLAFANDDVGSHFARRLDQPQRDRLGHDRDQERALGMRRFGQWRQIGDPAEDVGILHDHRARLAVDPGDQALDIGLGAELGRRQFERVAGELGHRLAHRDIMRVDARRQDRLRPAGDPPRHADRFPACGRAIVHRRIGDFTAKQPRDLRLEFEQHLQRALRDFRLVRRVGGQELAALDEVVDRRRDVMLVAPQPRKNGTSPATMFLRAKAPR